MKKPIAPATSGENAARETPLMFGDSRNLMGVMNLAGCRPGSHTTAVILVASGTSQCVGSFRLNVELAGSLSGASTPSFRFDPTGIGNRVDVEDTAEALTRGASEICSAMNKLQSVYGIEKFVLFGMNGRAEDCFHTALQDRRVRGMVMMNGDGYRTARDTVHILLGHYLRRAVSPQRWIDMINRRFNLAASEVSARIPVGSDIRDFPRQREAAVQIQTLVDRGVRMRYVFTGRVPERYQNELHYRNLFADVPRNPFVSTNFFPEIDTNELHQEGRDWLVRDMLGWTTEQFSSVSLPTVTFPATGASGTDATIPSTAI